jgi:hypothetical protein
MYAHVVCISVSLSLSNSQFSFSTSVAIAHARACACIRPNIVRQHRSARGRAVQCHRRPPRPPRRQGERGGEKRGFSPVSRADCRSLLRMLCCFSAPILAPCSLKLVLVVIFSLLCVFRCRLCRCRRLVLFWGDSFSLTFFPGGQFDFARRGTAPSRRFWFLDLFPVAIFALLAQLLILVLILVLILILVLVLVLVLDHVLVLIVGMRMRRGPGRRRAVSPPSPSLPAPRRKQGYSIAPRRARTRARKKTLRAPVQLVAAISACAAPPGP